MLHGELDAVFFVEHFVALWRAVGAGERLAPGTPQSHGDKIELLALTPLPTVTNVTSVSSTGVERS